MYTVRFCRSANMGEMSNLVRIWVDPVPTVLVPPDNATTSAPPTSPTTGILPDQNIILLIYSSVVDA
jgi:hypothetical protein